MGSADNQDGLPGGGGLWELNGAERTALQQHEPRQEGVRLAWVREDGHSGQWCVWDDQNGQCEAKKELFLGGGCVVLVLALPLTYLLCDLRQTPFHLWTSEFSCVKWRNWIMGSLRTLAGAHEERR